MKTKKTFFKVIAIYSVSPEETKPFYAINLSSAIWKTLKEKVLVIDMDTSYGLILEALKLENRPGEGQSIIKTSVGIDVISMQNVTEEEISHFKETYHIIVINLPPSSFNLVHHVCFFCDSIHLFITSKKDYLEKGYVFLEELVEKKLAHINDKLKIVINQAKPPGGLSNEEISWVLRRNINLFVPEILNSKNLINQDGAPSVLFSKESRYAKAVLTIAKQEANKFLGLALGSGAAFGLSHIGVLKVLEENDIQIDMISGSSIGALVASLWGLGYTSKNIEYIAEQLKDKLTIMRLLDFTIPISGIIPGHRLKRFLKSFLGEKTFEDLKIPVKIMVYDLANRETICIDSGPLIEAVFMSIAVPGIFKPIVQKDKVIIDGGVSEPVPVDILLKQGVNKIIAVNVLPGPEDMYRRNILINKMIKDEDDLISHSPAHIRLFLIIRRFLRKYFNPNIFDVIVTSMQSMEYMLSIASCEKASINLHPVLPELSSIDFHKVKEFIKKGEDEARLHIEEIKEIVYN